MALTAIGQPSAGLFFVFRVARLCDLLSSIQEFLRPAGPNNERQRFDLEFAVRQLLRLFPRPVRAIRDVPPRLPRWPRGSRPDSHSSIDSSTSLARIQQVG